MRALILLTLFARTSNHCQGIMVLLFIELSLMPLELLVAEHVNNVAD